MYTGRPDTGIYFSDGVLRYLRDCMHTFTACVRKERKWFPWRMMHISCTICTCYLPINRLYLFKFLVSSFTGSMSTPGQKKDLGHIPGRTVPSIISKSVTAEQRHRAVLKELGWDLTCYPTRKGITPPSLRYSCLLDI